MGIAKLASKFVSFDMIMFGLHKHLIITRARFPEFARKMAERDLVAQVMIHQEKSGYWFEFKGGKVRFSKGVHERARCDPGIPRPAHGQRIS